VLYFAYGSNLDYTRMLSRCADSDVFGEAILEGYRLVFMENNTKRIVANIIKNKNFTTHGVLYEVTESDMKKLDAFEGHPRVYKRAKVMVCIEGTCIEATTYIMQKKCEVYSSNEVHIFNRKYGAPKKDYMQFILNGYTMHGLPQEELMKSYAYSKNKDRERKKSTMNKTAIFVYGTLKRGYRNHRFMKDAEYIGEGKIDNFDIYTVGEHASYPAIVEGDGEVFGEVYTVTDRELVHIDRLEGYHGKAYKDNLYDKELVEVKMHGKTIKAYVYMWNKSKSLPYGSKQLIDQF